MNRISKYILIAAIAILANCNFAYAQSNINRLWRPCPASTTKAVVEIQLDGDINFVPCSGREVQVSGTATSNTVTFTGSTRTNYFPWFTTNLNLGKSPFAWDATTFTWNTTAEDGTFLMSFKPSAAAAGTFSVGATAAKYALTESTGNATVTGTTTITLNSAAGATTIGDTANSTNRTKLSITDSTRKFSFVGGAGGVTGIVDFSGVNDFNLLRTVTATGTTGNQTISKPAGSVNFAAAATSISVTNTLVTEDSIIMVSQNNRGASVDATCTTFGAAAVTAGSFKIIANAGCTAETRVSFWVLN